MVRFYKTYLGRLLLGIIVLIEAERQHGKDGVVGIVTAATGLNRGMTNEAHALATALDNYRHGYPDESPSNDDVLKGVFGQLTKRKSDDGDLLDVIVGALSLPFGNYFNTGSIKTLRDAILTPTELGDLKKAFKAASKCSCGYEFRSGESACITIHDGVVNFSCNRCHRPDYVRCDYCDEPITITPKVAMQMRNEVDCGCRKRKEQAAALTPEMRAQAQAVAQANRLARNRGRVPTATAAPGTAATFEALAAALQVAPTMAVDIETDMDLGDDL